MVVDCCLNCCFAWLGSCGWCAIDCLGCTLVLDLLYYVVLLFVATVLFLVDGV